jgi:cytoskeletal protein CcmA (bactofilin family)
MNGSRWWKPVFVTLAVLGCVGTHRTADAFEARRGDSIRIGAEETIEEDLFLAGERVVVEGTVNGDLYAAARSVVIRGAIRDSVTVFAGTVTVTGSVGGGIHAAAEEFILEGVVVGDSVVMGRSISLSEGAFSRGDLIAFGQKIMVNSPVDGYVLGAANTVGINSSIRGDVVLAVRLLTLLENARVGGDLRYMSENDAVIFPGAHIAGRVLHGVPKYRDRMREIFPFVIIAGIVGKLLSFVNMVVVGLVFVFIAPGLLHRLSNAIKGYPGQCAGWGALILFGAPLVIFIASATVFGLSLAVIAGFIYLVSLYLSQIITSQLIGRLLLGMRDEVSRGRLFAAFVLGLFLLRLVRFIPGIGVFVWAAASLFGLGALVVMQTRRNEAA